MTTFTHQLFYEFGIIFTYFISHCKTHWLKTIHYMAFVGQIPEVTWQNRSGLPHFSRSGRQHGLHPTPTQTGAGLSMHPGILLLATAGHSAKDLVFPAKGLFPGRT